MNQVTVSDRCQLPGIFQTEPKNARFVNERLKMTNGIQEIEPDKPFIFVANFANVLRKIPKHMLILYTSQSPTLLNPVDSPLLAHLLGSLGYVAPCRIDAVNESLPKTNPLVVLCKENHQTQTEQPKLLPDSAWHRRRMRPRCP